MYIENLESEPIDLLIWETGQKIVYLVSSDFPRQRNPYDISVLFPATINIFQDWMFLTKD
jgi:hypothetical protein